LGKPKDAIAAWNAGAAITGPNVDLDLLVILKEAPNTMLNPTSASATPPASASPAPALEPASNPMSILQDLLKKAATSEKPVVNDSIEKRTGDPFSYLLTPSILTVFPQTQITWILRWLLLPMRWLSREQSNTGLAWRA